MKETWTKAISNEYGRLAQGNDHGVDYQDAMEFIPTGDVPKDRDVTYASFRFDHRPLKAEQYRPRMVAGGDKLSYGDDPGSPAASLLETKLLLNSVISEAHLGARFLSADLKDFFLCSFMKTPEYMKIPVKFIPDDIIKKYNIKALEHKGYVYVKIKRGMYGLKQAAWLAYEQLQEYLKPYGYLPDPNHQCIWYHTTRRTRFCLCVDDFGIKYCDKADAEHLLNILRKYYKVSVDWEGRNYCGLTINWDYERKFVDISMPKYIEHLLHKCQHNPITPTYTPFKWTAPQYGKTQQFVKPDDTAPKLDKKGIKYVQSVIGSLLYYRRAVDPTILVALNELSTEQASPTTNTLQKIKQLLNYVATYPNTVLRFHANDMTLHVDSDAAYLVLPNAKSRIAGYFYLSTHPKFQTPPKLNAPVIVECKTLQHVVASAAEAQTGGLFHNARTTLPIREMLQTLGHPQPPTPIKTDNSTANDFVLKNLKQKNTIGSVTAVSNNNLKFIGTKVKITGLIILQNIIRLNITK